jgi:hypothetical protein
MLVVVEGKCLPAAATAPVLRFARHFEVIWYKADATGGKPPSGLIATFPSRPGWGLLCLDKMSNKSKRLRQSSRSGDIFPRRRPRYVVETPFLWIKLQFVQNKHRSCIFARQNCNTGAKM